VVYVWVLMIALSDLASGVTDGRRRRVYNTRPPTCLIRQTFTGSGTGGPTAFNGHTANQIFPCVMQGAELDFGSIGWPLICKDSLIKEGTVITDER